jgi:hypothetical protein
LTSRRRASHNALRWRALAAAAIVAVTAPPAADALPPAGATAAGGLRRPARVSRRAEQPARADARRGEAAPPAGRAVSGAQRAPSAAPLHAAPTAGVSGEELDSSASSAGELDPLVANGLSSPMCRGAPGGAQLSASSRLACETSGFVAAAAPTSDYGIDVHIDTGVFGLGSGWLLSTVQGLLVTPMWTALVWAVHALVVMLEWCFTIDLLDSPSVGAGLARGLRRAQATFTQPWLASVLAVAAVLAAYNGLVRRRVAETLAQALAVFAMIAGGLWVTLDPLGTVGALGRWANQAGLGTLAVSASGSPAHAGQALADSMGTLFSVVVEVPWCYLEFGDVGWCRDQTRLDPHLHAAALSIAAGELALARCQHGAAGFGPCPAAGSHQAQALEHSARLLRSAGSNGAIFLALPANGPQRNSINDHESLLWAICQSDNATACRGASAAQAEFRTNRGTWPRVAGLLLIVGGVLGMLLLLGFLALRLLASAVISLLYLMVAPAAVLAPALGDGGREVFRRWLTQLLGAVVSKLLFSFLLGAVLAVLAILASLEAIGWWTQWLLMSAFWWGAFVHRHRVLQVAGGATGRVRAAERRTLARRAGEAIETPRRVVGGVRAARRRREERHAVRVLASEDRRTAAPSAPPMRQATPGEPRRRGGARRAQGHAGADAQAQRTLLADYREARAYLDAQPAVEQRLSAMGARLARLREHRAAARASGQPRRTARLTQRAADLEGRLERERAQLAAARETVAAQRTQRRRGVVFGAEQTRDRERLLAAQAALAPSARMHAGEDARRDYTALAGLAGYGSREYDGLAASDKRKARLAIDRELRSRTAPQAPYARETHQAAAPPARGAPADVPPALRPQPPATSESSVMADMREVAARRKRQLGRGRA